MCIVRIQYHRKLNASAVRLAEGDLTQLRNNPFAEDEPDDLRRLCEMTVRRW
jgi:hypothetical protein